MTILLNIRPISKEKGKIRTNESTDCRKPDQSLQSLAMGTLIGWPTPGNYFFDDWGEASFQKETR
ncbi:MAG: hypothetical protein NPIRA01_26190 [Nitrospirales bacterium]|nr:MAG: hypothetical protein NPIRA01_26190 [Nitrospirales bacterium]